MLGSSLRLGQHAPGEDDTTSVVHQLTSGVCDGRSRHDYEVTEEDDDSVSFECRRCGARLIEYPE